MALIKRSGYWHFDFIFKGRRIQGSTHQTNKNLAKLVEAKVRSDAALEAFGIIQPKTSPMFSDFMEGKFLTHVRKHAKKPRTVEFYSVAVRRLIEYPPFRNLRLSQIDSALIADYTRKVSVATLNGELRTLSKAMNLAEEWKLIPAKVKIRMLPGEHKREFILTGELETRYLSLVDYPLRQAAILMLDMGLRPEECVSLKKADVTVEEVIIRDGKSENATRALPHTDRTKEAIQLLCALWPDSEFLFPGRKGRHLNRKSLDNMHARIRSEHSLPAEFVLYSLRHTFATRLAETGASPFDLKAALGHGSITMSERYIHVSGDHLRIALKRKEVLDKTIRGEVHEETSIAEKSRTS